jgi:aryl-alcohol dehydrogenase-like predicted oxidoreductase
MALGFSKIGTKAYHSTSHIKDRLAVIDELSKIGRVFLDTSPIYGSGFSEETLGNFMAHSSGKYFVASKYFPENNTNPTQVIKSVEDSLTRLQLEKIDLVQLHWPNPLANLQAVVEGLSKLFEEEKIGSLGTCNFSQSEMSELCEIWPFGLLTNQQEINLNNIGSCSELVDPEGAYTMSYSTLLQGRLTFSRDQRKFLINSATEIGLTPAALTLAIINNLEPEIFPILKVSSVRHLEELVHGWIEKIDESIFYEFQKIEQPQVKYVDPLNISLIGDSSRKPYLSEEDALRNSLELFPSPASLSERVLKFNLILPVKVVALNDALFQIDDYDPFDQIKKYWAWRLAFPGEKIPVIVFESEEGAHN